MSAAENPAPRKDPLAFYLDKAVPDAWKAVGGLAAAVRTAAEEAGLDRQLVELVNLRVSQINGCGFCLDLHAREGAKAGLSAQRMALLPAWREAEAVYSEQERAALELAEAVTELSRSSSTTCRPPPPPRSRTPSTRPSSGPRW